MRPRWRRLRIGVRLVVVVTASMAVLLLLGSGFVFWRVRFALDRQIGADLTAYDRALQAQLGRGAEPGAGGAGEYWRLYDEQGRLLASSTPDGPDLRADGLTRTALTGVTTYEVGDMFARSAPSLLVAVRPVATPDGRRVLVAAIDRSHRDEALRELLGQLALADLLVLAGAALVGVRTARLALEPVERYRLAAAEAEGHAGVRLPVPTDRDDELTRLGRTLNGLLSRLEAASGRERRFVADASHELRTPLSVMRAEIEHALHRPPGAADHAGALRELAGHVDRLTELSDSLLALERLETGEEPDRVATDVPALLSEVAAARRTPERDIEVTSAVPGKVAVAPAWLRLAVDNLVLNALTHGRGRVLVSAALEHDLLVVRVTDEGGGLPESFARHAFERFTRADSSRSTSGSGLGLALVGAVARAHGGAAVTVPGGVELRLPG